VAQAVLLHGVQGSVHCHAPCPCFKWAVAPVLVEASKDFDERIL
jgi:hypothetical protein